jgi:hypothetical protein
MERREREKEGGSVGWRAAKRGERQKEVGWRAAKRGWMESGKKRRSGQNLLAPALLVSFLSHLCLSLVHVLSLSRPLCYSLCVSVSFQVQLLQAIEEARNEAATRLLRYAPIFGSVLAELLVKKLVGCHGVFAVRDFAQ